MEDFFAEAAKDTAGKLTCIPLPFNAKEVFHKSKGTIHVKGTINEVSYRSKLLSRGNGKYMMTIDKALQKSIGFTGKPMAVHVTMSLDEEDCQTVANHSQPEFAASSMDVITAVQTRQSIREFTQEAISQDLINTILYAGMCAPTAKNKRPVDFVLIDDKKTLYELSLANPNARMLEHAPCAIVVCGDQNREGSKEFLYADCGAAAQNILLCAHGLHLGAVWCGVAANSPWFKLLTEKLSLPVKIAPVAVIALGYPAVKPQPKEKWSPGKVHYGKW